MLPLHLLQAPLAIFFNLHRGQSLLLVHNLILHAILLLNFEALELLFLLILLLNHLGLLGLLTSGLEDGLLHFALLICSLLLDREVLLSYHALVFILHLIIVDFLCEEAEITRLSKCLTDSFKLCRLTIPDTAIKVIEWWQ